MAGIVRAGQALSLGVVIPWRELAGHWYRACYPALGCDLVVRAQVVADYSG